MTLPAYEVTVTREDNLWVAVAQGLPEGLVGAADFDHFADIEDGMREVIADLTDSDPGRFDVIWRYDLGGDTTKTVLEYLAAQRSAHEAVDRRDQARAKLVRTLRGKLSQRAIADLLGLSHQRVNQLINS